MTTLRNLFVALTDLSVCKIRTLSTPATIFSRGVRRHTRTLSATPSEPSANTQHTENKDIQVNKYFYNRNPRALEYMGLAKKVKGWRFQYPPKDFYHRLSFITTNKHTAAQVEHNNGAVVVSASTKEIAISRHLRSNTDVSAAENIGHVLARRCLQCGISNMTMLPPEIGIDSETFVHFERALKDGGVALWEPEEVVPHYEPGIDYDDEEAVAELEERQRKVAELSEEHKTFLKFRSRRPGSRVRTPPKPHKYYM